MNLVISIIFLSITGIFAFYILFTYLLNRAFHLPHISCKKFPEDFNLEYINHFITTEHNKKIQLWEFGKDRSLPHILFTHGWANAADSFLPLVPYFTDSYQVFLLNTRNHGDSEDGRHASIIQYKTDILTAVDYIAGSARNKVNIFLVGHSLGGAASLYAASENDSVDGVVSIGSFADMEKFMYTWLRRAHMPRLFITSMISYIEIRTGIRFADISPSATIRQYKGPVLIVHGTQDETVPFTALTTLKKSANRENVKTLKLKGHSHSSMLADRQLASDIKQFFSAYLS